jgi:lysophospholipase L1-like esterase
MKFRNNWPLIWFLALAIFPASCTFSGQDENEMWPEDINYAYLASARIDRIMSHKPEKTKIAMLGNSITEGGRYWNILLGRNDVLNSGQGGYTTQQFTWLLDSCIYSTKPEYCFIMGGINDISLGIPVSRIFSNYKYIITQLRRHRIQVVVQSTLYQADNPESFRKVTELNGLLIAWCDKRRIPFVDLNTEMSDETGLRKEITTDGTHLNAKGYEIWSGILKNFFRKAFI